MNGAQAHLLLNHLPVLGVLFGALLMAAGLWRRSADLKNASLVVLFLAAIVVVPTYLSGEPAEELVEELPGVSHDDIHEHEDAALFGLIGVLALGVLSALTWVMMRRQSAKASGLLIATFALSLFVTSIMMRVSWLGGEIRHTELSGGAVHADNGHDSD